MDEKEFTFFDRQKNIFFRVAGTPPREKEKRQAYNLSGIPKNLLKQCEFYFLSGRMVRSKLSRVDKFMLKMGPGWQKTPKTGATC
jgi:hypothetical protein